MKVQIALASSLPKYIEDMLPVRPDVLRTLIYLPLGTRIGKYPEQSPHTNALRYAAENNVQLYTGYYVNRTDTRHPWEVVRHSFCVNKGKVIEPTDISWNGQTFYVGREVPRNEYANLKFVHTLTK
jgi:hypothetical protein